VLGKELGGGGKEFLEINKRMEAFTGAI